MNIKTTGDQFKAVSAAVEDIVELFDAQLKFVPRERWESARSELIILAELLRRLGGETPISARRANVVRETLRKMHKRLESNLSTPRWLRKKVDLMLDALAFSPGCPVTDGCTACGARVESDHRFCPVCGEPLC